MESLSLLVLASAVIQPAQSVIVASRLRQCFGTVGLDWREIQEGFAES